MFILQLLNNLPKQFQKMGARFPKIKGAPFYFIFPYLFVE